MDKHVVRAVATIIENPRLLIKLPGCCRGARHSCSCRASLERPYSSLREWRIRECASQRQTAEYTMRIGKLHGSSQLATALRSMKSWIWPVIVHTLWPATWTFDVEEHRLGRRIKTQTNGIFKATAKRKTRYRDDLIGWNREQIRWNGTNEWRRAINKYTNWYRAGEWRILMMAQ